MRKIGRHIGLLVLAVVLCSAFGFGQEAKLITTVDKNPVSINDSFKFEVTLINGSGQLEIPDLSDFRVIFGPTRSQSMRNVNGVETTTYTFAYTLKPRKKGTFEIGVAKVNVDGKTLTTSPIQLKVVDGSSTRTAPSQGRNQSTGAKETSANENIRFVIQPSKKTAYKGESVGVTYYLLSRYENINHGLRELPSPSGFWIENIPQKQLPARHSVESINGVYYRKDILAKQVLFPQRTGKLGIDQIEVPVVVGQGLFRPGKEYTIKSNSPTLTVKPLPGGAPESFSGAVGSLDFSASVEKTDLKANEAVNLKVRITGSGNLTLITMPEPEFPGDFEVYDPETKDNVSVTTSGLKGSRTQQFLMIPRAPGEFTIPELEFSFFNPRSGTYETRTAGPFNFKVSDEAGNVPSEGAKRPKKVVGQSGLDIRYIITNAERLQEERSQFFGTPLFWAGSAGPFVLFLLFLGWKRREEALDKDATGRKKRGASKMARKRLKAAEAALKSGDSSVFYQEISKALYGYLSDKLAIPIGQLSRPKIQSKLIESGVNEAAQNDVAYVIDTCEMARFAPVTETSDEVFYKRTAELIEKLEGKLK